MGVLLETTVKGESLTILDSLSTRIQTEREQDEKKREEEEERKRNAPETVEGEEEGNNSHIEVHNTDI